MRLHEARKDFYRKLAKEQGYKSRAAFKLIEANEKYGFIKRGSRVVDFGSAPGGWLQVASDAAGEEGLVVGVDMHDFNVRRANVKMVKADVMETASAQAIGRALSGRRADAVLSDLAPSVSGVWELDQTRQADLTLRVLDLSREFLKPGGSGFFKLFEGERSGEVRAAFRATFKTVRPLKPAASRSVSSELYYYCEGWRGDSPAIQA